MACPACRRHVQEAGAYRWAVEQARALLRHEFDCQGEGGPNALIGCLACALDRLALRASPDITLAAARQPWLERAAGLVASGGAPSKERTEILEGLDRAERMATLRLEAAARAAEKERVEREKRAQKTRSELAAPPGVPKEAAMAKKGKKARAGGKRTAKQPARPPGQATAGTPAGAAGTGPKGKGGGA